MKRGNDSGTSPRVCEMTAVPEPGGASFETDATVTLFGFEPSPVRATVTPRSRAWRVGGATRTMVIATVIAPIVAIFPPHAIWPIGALLTGGTFARRRYIERFTLRSVEGACPKCGAPIRVKSTRLRVPHQIACEACNHESLLRLPDGVLEAAALE